MVFLRAGMGAIVREASDETAQIGWSFSTGFATAPAARRRAFGGLWFGVRFFLSFWTVPSGVVPGLGGGCRFQKATAPAAEGECTNGHRRKSSGRLGVAGLATMQEPVRDRMRVLAAERRKVSYPMTNVMACGALACRLGLIPTACARQAIDDRTPIKLSRAGPLLHRRPGSHDIAAAASGLERRGAEAAGCSRALGLI